MTIEQTGPDCGRPRTPIPDGANESQYCGATEPYAAAYGYQHDCELATIARLRARVAELEAAAGHATSWPARDVMAKLADAADILLNWIKRRRFSGCIARTTRATKRCTSSGCARTMRAGSDEHEGLRS